MSKLTMREAISQALWEEMERDPRVFILGEEVGVWGGTYAVTKGFYDHFGAERVRDTPIAEAAIIGSAIGAALAGARPVAELMTINFAFAAMDHIVNQAAKLHYMFNGQMLLPLVIRAVGGGGRQLGATHSQTPDAIFAHFPGLKVVAPGTPADAKGLLKSAIRSDDPVLFLEHATLYQLRGEVPEGEHLVPIGQSAIQRPGRDVTLVTYSKMLEVSERAAAELAKDGVEVEIVDLRTLRPLDMGPVLELVPQNEPRCDCRGRLAIVWRGRGDRRAHLRGSLRFCGCPHPACGAAGSPPPIQPHPGTTCPAAGEGHHPGGAGGAVMADIVIMPKLGFDMAEGMFVRWVRQVGEGIAKGEVLAEIETDKATVEVESGFSGVVRQHLVEAGTSVPIGSPIAVIGTADEVIEPTRIAAPSAGVGRPIQAGPPAAGAARAAATVAEGVAQPESMSNASGRPAASPLARRLAADAGLDLTKMRGTGAGGRITRKDVEAARGAPKARPAAPAAPIATIPLPALSPTPSGEDRRIPLSRLRQAIGRRMIEAKQQLPHFYVTHEYRMEPLMAVRAQANAYLGEAEKLSVTDFLVKAVAMCLRQFPNLNASLAGDAVVQHAEVNVGVAVAVEGGLLTVVTREADRKPLLLLARETREMVARAREGKVRPADVDGSTFTLSNLGMFEVEEFVAIINPPEAAILAIGSVREVAVVDGTIVKPGLRMKATLSADHRVTDGAEAARFLQALAQYIENPAGLLL